MREKSITLKFIDFEDIQIGDVLVFLTEDENEEDFLYYRVTEITDDRILAHDPNHEEDCQIHKKTLYKNSCLPAECECGFRPVDSILRNGEILWECVDEQVFKALH